ncbi:peptidoglycan-recognition protein LC isoform X2 [Drosophila bipectinata]|uniref:peptidoglycan-recognition protein LC isoform X2 n=1 Tax=Drosophila bipectinata TaxID=42026 RepID=UPI001C88F6C6|nr:peptidoglycan-recognition protein LC isoform X2 [Drosophila bipectinata]XP_017101463.2 peptidoglycan-recognition protein LC isoform X2 [Drosophila bipectinata]
MHLSNEPEMNDYSHQNSITIDLTAAKNCSTSSTDSGVILNDNAAVFRRDKETKDKAEKHGDPEAPGAQADTPSDAKRISIEHTVNITQSATKKSSPTVSVRSTTISIVSIDENAPDSSCIDSDSEADAEDYTIQKLGHQVSYPPNSSHLRDLNQGLTVIARQVAPSQAEVPPPTPCAAGAVAKQILNGNLALATPTAPPGGGATQGIGSIALTNSTDVTFGDKHFYEGPVTIQQFLIDNRDKWKSGDGSGGGQDNPGFNGGTTANGSATGSKLDDPQTPPLCPFLPNTVGRKAVTITVVFVLLTTVLGIVLATTTNLFGKTLNQTDDSEVHVDGKLVVIGRKSWGGMITRGTLPLLDLPVSRVIISDTRPENCQTRESCSYWARVVQSRHMDTYGWPQVGYNFLVGGDGRIYEGRGWDVEGRHTRFNDKDSIGISFLGDFRKTDPTEKALEACQLLMDQGVRLKKLIPNYDLLGHRQLTGTLMPAENLYVVLQTWPHWKNLTTTTSPVSYM